MGDYDGNVSLSRKMAEDEIRELRIVLLPYFHISGGEVEDITDFLDYAFAMISNSKTIDYIVKELLGMEMEFCGQEVANKVGKELATFVTMLNTGGEAAPQEEEEGEEDVSKQGGGRVVSLKVRE
jgi:hypothetical protein